MDARKAEASSAVRCGLTSPPGGDQTMTHDTTTTDPANGRPAEDYRTSDGLRALLNRLHAA